MVADQHRPGERLEHGLRGGHRLLLAPAALQQDDELVAAEPGDQVAQRAEGGLQPGADGGQQLVAHVVAEAVVDHLETVEVDVAEAEAGTRLGLLEQLLQPLEEGRAVGQAGQRVVGGLVAQPLLEPVAVGDVLQHRDLVLRDAVVVADQRDGQVGPDHLAVLAVVRLVELEVVPLSADQLLVRLPHARGVLGVHEVADPAPDHVLRARAEQVLEGLVDRHDVAVGVADADADRGALEQRPEPGLGRAQRPLGLLAGGVGGGADRLLLDQRALAQGARPAGREGAGQGRAAVVVDGLRLEQLDRPGQQHRVGEVRVDQFGAGLRGQPRLERVALLGAVQQRGGARDQPAEQAGVDGDAVVGGEQPGPVLVEALRVAAHRGATHLLNLVPLLCAPVAAGPATAARPLPLPRVVLPPGPGTALPAAAARGARPSVPRPSRPIKGGTPRPPPRSSARGAHRPYRAGPGATAAGRPRPARPARSRRTSR